LAFVNCFSRAKKRATGLGRNPKNLIRGRLPVPTPFGKKRREIIETRGRTGSGLMKTAENDSGGEGPVCKAFGVREEATVMGGSVVEEGLPMSLKIGHS